jgi:diadenosine tetraphosphate (Ap4A) HIT family hydrolase
MTYDNNNIFARILRGEIPCKKCYEDEIVLAFHDISPAAAVHILAVPKTAHKSFDDFTMNASEQEISAFFKAIQKITTMLGIDKTGYRLITNHGEDGFQTVPHFHVHILGGEKLEGF